MRQHFYDIRIIPPQVRQAPEGVCQFLRLRLVLYRFLQSTSQGSCTHFCDDAHASTCPHPSLLQLSTCIEQIAPILRHSPGHDSLVHSTLAWLPHSPGYCRNERLHAALIPSIHASHGSIAHRLRQAPLTLTQQIRQLLLHTDVEHLLHTSIITALHPHFCQAVQHTSPVPASLRMYILYIGYNSPDDPGLRCTLCQCIAQLPCFSTDGLIKN
mmetsp:Transcript_13302/g.35610  ORF Transcript_13302/g.35610 Transcript_13302/m.35610 type:complete len:213 (-) Transcript_13302:441-1079(-)